METSKANPKSRPSGLDARVSGHIAVSAADGSLPQEQMDSWLVSTSPGVWISLCDFPLVSSRARRASSFCERSHARFYDTFLRLFPNRLA